MKSRYALLDIDLALFDFVIQDDAAIFYANHDLHHGDCDVSEW